MKRTPKEAKKAKEIVRCLANRAAKAHRCYIAAKRAGDDDRQTSEHGHYIANVLAAKLVAYEFGLRSWVV